MQPLFRHDNTEGYTDEQLAAFNAEWDGIVRDEGLEPGSDWYNERAKQFCDQVNG